MIKDFNVAMSWMTLVVGAYFLIFGIIKKGSLYKNDYPREIQDEVKKAISFVSVIAGVILLIIGLLDVFKVDSLKWLNISLWVLGFIFVIISIVYFRKKFGQYMK